SLPTRRSSDLLGLAAMDPRWPGRVWSLLDALAAAEHRATRAEAERDGWRQTALDERGAALDALEQIKARDARIKAVQAILDENPAAYARTYNHDIRRALDGDA